MNLRYISRWILRLTVCVSIIFICTGQEGKEYLSRPIPSAIYYTVSVPSGWRVDGFQCNGITAQDNSTPARGIIYMNRLHSSFDLLPPGVTPEAYLEEHMARDFSLGPNSVSEIKLLLGEDSHFCQSKHVSDLLSSSPSGDSPTSTKCMICSYKVNGIPTKGSFVIKTRDLNDAGTQIDYLLGIYAPANQFDTDLPMLLEAFNSIQLNPYYRDVCE